MSKFNRHEWNRAWRANKKALAKAIKQHRRRSHLRLEAINLDAQKATNLYGGICCFMAHRMRKRSRQLSAAISDNNPLLEMLKKHGAILDKSQSWGSAIYEPIKTSEDQE